MTAVDSTINSTIDATTPVPASSAGLIAPHGGVLVNLMVAAGQREPIKLGISRSVDLPEGIAVVPVFAADKAEALKAAKELFPGHRVTVVLKEGEPGT